MSFLKLLSTRKSKSPVGDSSPSKYTAPRSQACRSPTSAEMDAPPAYSAAVSPAFSSTSTAKDDDSPYAFLGQFDTVFIIDDSGSMAGSRWKETQAALRAIAPICTAQDVDGLDVYFLNHRSGQKKSSLGGYTKVTTAAGVDEIFQRVKPQGITPTGMRLNQILKQHLNDLARTIERQNKGQEICTKPLNIIVITDGVSSDDVEAVIVNAARKLDQMGAEPWQVGIQFFQVGDDQAAAADLRDLDDAISEEHGVRDMVDTVPWNATNVRGLTCEGIMKVTMGAINRKLDRKKATG